MSSAHAWGGVGWHSWYLTAYLLEELSIVFPQGLHHSLFSAATNVSTYRPALVIVYTSHPRECMVISLCFQLFLRTVCMRVNSVTYLCGSLNEGGPHGLMYLDTWCPGWWVSFGRIRKCSFVGEGMSPGAGSRCQILRGP